MSERQSATIAVVIELDRAEMARRGRLGGAARAAKHDCREIGRRAAATLRERMSPEELHERFSLMGRHSAEARRARKAEEEGGRVA